jgi:hypothetical protein
MGCVTTGGRPLVLLLVGATQMALGVNELNIIFMTDTDGTGAQWPVVVEWVTYQIAQAQLIPPAYNIK